MMVSLWKKDAYPCLHAVILLVFRRRTTGGDWGFMVPFPVGARDFGLLFHPDRLWCSHILLLKRIAGSLSSRVKQPGPEANHCPPSSTAVKDSSSNRSTVVHSFTCLYDIVLTWACSLHVCMITSAIDLCVEGRLLCVRAGQLNPQEGAT
jgi:hypothetical protein